jgi:hypothetical protein
MNCRVRKGENGRRENNIREISTGGKRPEK